MVGLRNAVRDLSDPVGADLLENDDAYLLIIDLPGATADRTTISTTDGTVHVIAEREPVVSDATILTEERPRRLELELPLPSDAQPEKAEASLANGVLELTLPKGTVGVSIPIEES